MPDSHPTDPTRCPVCGQRNQCTLANPATATRPCWCFSVTINVQPLTHPLAADNPDACLCPNCARVQPLADTDAP